MVGREKHPWNCPCEMHAKQRQNARELQERKARGEPARLKTAPHAVPDQKIQSRLVEDKTGSEAIVVHWMPAEGNEWVCPECGRQFLRIEGQGWEHQWAD